MVEFKENAPSEEAAKPNGGGASKFCRLCLEQDTAVKLNIFEEHTILGTDHTQKKIPISQQLFELFRIKYEKSKNLPCNICQHCLSMVESFSIFRENIQRCEMELQKWLEHRQKTGLEGNEICRPGLNGYPGEFELDENCIITDIDPEQECESSDEDFSMDSDSEIDESPSKLHPSESSGIATMLDAEDSRPRALNEFGSVAGLATDGDSLNADFSVKNTFLCQYCDMAFTTQPDCAEHESRHDLAAPYGCNYCAIRYTTRPHLIQHIKENHDGTRPYVCALCNKGFCRRSDLKKHTIVHTGVRPFTCHVCSKSFSRNTNLTKHMRIHASVKPHVCQQCPRSFSSANELLRHARTHSELKPFKCGRCTASFTRKDKLTLHEQSHYRRDSEFLLNQGKMQTHHGGVVPNEEYLRRAASAIDTSMENMMVPLNLNNFIDEHGNPIVGGGGGGGAPEDVYRQHSILAAQLQRSVPVPTTTAGKQHQRPNNGRVFTCKICSKKFTRERDLQRHSALHLDTLFTCKQCGTTFNRKEKLARHEQEFHKPQYRCPQCFISFNQVDLLEQHMKLHELQQNYALTSQVASGGGVGAMPPSLQLGGGGGVGGVGMHPADMSFYSQMVPTMNLGFYSETHPELDRNII